MRALLRPALCLGLVTFTAAQEPRSPAAGNAEVRATLEVATEARRHAEQVLARGETEEAHRAFAEVVDVLLELPAELREPRSMTCLLEVAEVLRGQPPYDAERRAREALLEYRRSRYPSDAVHVQEARERLTRVLHAQGEFEAALELIAEGLAASGEDGDTDSVRALIENKAGILLKQGHNYEGRALLEELLRRDARRPTRSTTFVTAVRNNLGVAVWHMGDLLKARAIFQELYEERRDPSVLGNLAGVLAELQDPGTAELRREVRDAFADFPRDHPYRRNSELNYATALGPGQWAEARPVFEELARGTDSVALIARYYLGEHLAVSGELDAAAAVLQEVLAERLALHPLHPFVTSTRLELARVHLAREDRAALERVLNDQLDTHEQRLLELVGASRRSRSALVYTVLSELPLVDEMALETEHTEALRRRVFELTEGLRAFSASSPRVPLDAELSPAIDACRVAWRTASSAWLKEVRSDPADAGLLPPLQALQESERSFREAVLEAGWGLDRGVTVAAAAARLAPDEAAVTYQQRRDQLLAHVLLPGGGLVRVELGSIRTCQEAVRAWRSAIRQPLAGARLPAQAPDERAAGAALRALVLDPVRARAPGAQRLYLCLEGALHLVPLEALPAPGGAPHAVVGDTLRLVRVSSLAVRPARSRDDGMATELLVVGAAAFGPGNRFAPVDDVQPLLRSMRDGFVARRGGAAVVLTGAAAEEEQVRRAAERATQLFVHSHGFVDERWRSWNEGIASLAPSTEIGARSLQRHEELELLAPLALSGLALAGANDDSGRGLLFAEELSTWDLRRCRLAVLSACETAAGIERAGQGVWSMQAALQAAGVETTVTALWEVDRRWTERLMREFHAGLWSEEPLEPEEALWRAKQVLREERVPTKDWAGWVLGSALTDS